MNRALKTRHPIASLLIGGVFMVIGLLPLFLAELDRFSGISDFWKLAGVTLTTVGVIGIIWVVLRHSGRAKQDEDVDEHEATQTWLKGLDVAIKCVGATALVVITHWFGVLTKQQEAKRLKAEKESQEWRQNTDRVSLLLEGISRDNVAARVAAVCVAGELLQETGQSSLSILQALYSISISAGDSTVQDAAKAFLPAIKTEADRYNVIDAVLGSSDTMQQETAKLRRSMQALEMIRDHAFNRSYRYAADKLLKQLDTTLVDQGQQLAKQVSEGKADAEPKLVALAPALVMAAADNSNQQQKSEAAKLVSALPPDVVQKTIAGLPVATVQQISPRVYLHIASEAERTAAQAIRSKLTSQSYIVPGIQNVSGRGYIPDTLEVRYFDLDSKSTAEKILGVIKNSGAKDGRVSYVIPTANDLRISSDIKSHFEVWAGRNSF